MSCFFNSGAKKADLPIYTKEEVAMHRGPEDIWIIVNGNVYNFSKFQYKHPGGRHWMVQYAGLDATNVFMSAHHRDDPKPKDMIGRLASKVAEVEAHKKGSPVKKLFNWGNKSEGNGAPDTENMEISVSLRVGKARNMSLLNVSQQRCRRAQTHRDWLGLRRTSPLRRRPPKRKVCREGLN